MLDAGTRDRMRASGPVVWLRATVETLCRRIAADDTTAARRPNLTAAGGREEVTALLESLNAGGTTLIVVTHDPVMGERARRQLLMEDGALRRDLRAGAASLP